MLLLVDLGKIGDLVAGFEGTAHMEVHPHIDPLVPQALDPVEVGVQGCRVQLLRGRAVLDQAWIDPTTRIVVMEADQIEAKLSNTPGMGLDQLTVLDEEGIGLDIAAPEPNRRAIPEHQILALGLDEAMLPRRLVIEVAQIDETGRRRQGIAEPRAGVRIAIALVQRADARAPLGQREAQLHGALPRRNLIGVEHAADHPPIAPFEVDVRESRLGRHPQDLAGAHLPLPALLVEQLGRLALASEHPILIGRAELQSPANGLGRGFGHIEGVGRDHLPRLDGPGQAPGKVQSIRGQRPGLGRFRLAHGHPGPTPLCPPEDHLRLQDLLAVHFEHWHARPAYRVLQLPEGSADQDDQEQRQANHD